MNLGDILETVAEEVGEAAVDEVRSGISKLIVVVIVLVVFAVFAAILLANAETPGALDTSIATSGFESPSGANAERLVDDGWGAETVAAETAH